MALIIIIFVSLSASWDDYWLCLEPCWAEADECYAPCDEVYRVCGEWCAATLRQRERLNRQARFVRCATGPGRTWRHCRYIRNPLCDPWGWYPSWVEACEEGLPDYCRDCDVDGDGDVDLYDWSQQPSPEWPRFFGSVHSVR